MTGIHVLTEKLPAFSALFLSPAFPFCVDLANTDGDLGWAKIRDIYGLKNGFANGHHWMLLHLPCLGLSLAKHRAE